MPEWNFVKEGDRPEMGTTVNGWTDPVFKLGDKFGFFDEIWSDSCGPFGTRDEALASCRKYAEECL